MIRERYQRVTAAELKVGDVVTIEPDLDPWTMSHFDVDHVTLMTRYKADGDRTEYHFDNSRKVFRLVSTNEEDVLRLALEIMITGGGDRKPRDSELQIINQFVDQARRQLAAEASGTKGGE